MSTQAANSPAPVGYDDTPFLPNSPWRVHDGTRPQPPIVTPGARDSDPPADALVLFDGTDLSQWMKVGGGEAGWKVESGYMQVVARAGNIETKEHFGDCQLHLEWVAPAEGHGNSQGRGNSGVFLMGLYEIQVLDCYDNPTYADGTTAAIYGQSPPLVNACRQPGQWQTYDIIWVGPRFDQNRLVRPAHVTVIHNGIVVHHHRELIGRTGHKTVGAYTAHAPTGPLMLQDHGDAVRYRNIWVRPLTE